MKIVTEHKLESTTKETLEIKIEFDPSSPNEEGYAALVATLCDTLRRVTFLEEALDTYEDSTL